MSRAPRRWIGAQGGLMALLCLLALLVGAPGRAADPWRDLAFTATASGLEVSDQRLGTGAPVVDGARVTAHYTGWFTDASVFDSSLERGTPFTWQHGRRHVIAGWEEGVADMRAGGIRWLRIPYPLAYGEAGRPPTIPAKATLVFRIEVLDVEAPMAVPPFPDLSAPGAFATTASGLRVREVVVGTGAPAAAGTTVRVHYTGWLLDGTSFDSSVTRGVPAEFPLGSGRLIAGWEEGIVGMRPGGRRQLVIPAALGYGDAALPTIPARSTLVFDVTLLAVVP